MASGDSRSEQSEKNYAEPADAGRESVLDEWTDVEYEPLPFNDVVAIEFSDEFRNIFGLLLTVQHRKERSERCLQLSRAAIELNKADVTAWRFRQETAEALAREKGANIWTSELPFVTAIIMKSPKNYQAWEYRRLIAIRLDQFDAEIDFVDLMLDRDAKNYHAWAHRYWVVRSGLVQSDELGATQWFISNDVRNNSAWNHRWLLVKDLDLSAREAQMRWALDIVGMAARNGSAWNFVHALVASGVTAEFAKKAALLFLENDEDNVPARRFLVLNGTVGDVPGVPYHCDILMKVDAVRSKYWAFKRQSWDRVQQKNRTTERSE